MVLMVRLLLESMEFIFCYFSQYILAWSFAFELIQFPFCFYFSCCWSLFQFSLVGILVIVFFLLSFSFSRTHSFYYLLSLSSLLPSLVRFHFTKLGSILCLTVCFVNGIWWNSWKIEALWNVLMCAHYIYFVPFFRDLSGTQFLYMLVRNACVLLTWFRTSKYIKVMDERCINNWTMPSIHHCKSFERGIYREYTHTNKCSYMPNNDRNMLRNWS